jgi:hypothetical protein
MVFMQKKIIYIYIYIYIYKIFIVIVHHNYPNYPPVEAFGLKNWILQMMLPTVMSNVSYIFLLKLKYPKD